MDPPYVYTCLYVCMHASFHIKLLYTPRLIQTLCSQKQREKAEEEADSEDDAIKDRFTEVGLGADGSPSSDDGFSSENEGQHVNAATSGRGGVVVRSRNLSHFIFPFWFLKRFFNVMGSYIFSLFYTKVLRLLALLILLYLHVCSDYFGGAAAALLSLCASNYSVLRIIPIYTRGIRGFGGGFNRSSLIWWIHSVAVKY